MIEVRSFATLREGHGQIIRSPAAEASTAADLLRRIKNSAQEPANLLIYGFRLR